MHKGDGHVVPVTDEGDIDILQLAEFLNDSECVSHALTGVVVVGESVDDRDPGILSQFQQVFVFEDTGHDGVNESAQYLSDVFDRFPFAETDFIRSEVEGIAAQLVHSDLERDAGAQAGFLENQGKCFSGKDRLVAAGFEFCF